MIILGQNVSDIARSSSILKVWKNFGKIILTFDKSLRLSVLKSPKICDHQENKQQQEPRLKCLENENCVRSTEFWNWKNYITVENLTVRVRLCPFKLK